MATGHAEVAGLQAVQLLEEGDASILGALHKLDLQKVDLTALPSAGRSLALCTKLRHLDLGGNSRLGALPDVVAALPSLEVLFASNTGLTEVPSFLRSCPKLRMLGVKDNEICSVDGENLPEHLSWLICAGNSIREMPNIGRLQHVRKLMLSHNQLTCEALAPVAGIAGLEMLRVAANRLDAFPKALLEHPRLAWVAVGSNPFTEAALRRRLASAPDVLDFKELSLGARLGSGAGATVYSAEWRQRQVAAKIWEAEKFSDGTAHGEWAVNRVAAKPGNPTLVGVLGCFEEPKPGMVLELLQGAIAAGGAPNFDTVTRDATPSQGGTGPLLTATAALKVAKAVALACEYLHAHGMIHGDVYLHNTLVVPEGEVIQGKAIDVSDVRLSDFGAAAVVEGETGACLQRLEVRSYGWLLQDLIDMLRESSPDTDVDGLSGLRQLCSCADVSKLPSFSEIAQKISALFDAAGIEGSAKKPRLGTAAL